MSEVILQRPRIPPNCRAKLLLLALGLPKRALWPEAARRIKSLLVRARRDGDIELSVRLSEAKAFLRANLPSQCGGCGKTISAGGVSCKMCRRNT
jgi:hypothetical protein